jgi:phenylalanine-4-hydroxylase
MEDFLFMTHHAGGTLDLMLLNPEHPGFLDAEYRERRDAIAQLALSYRSGQEIPRVVYSKEEHDIWNKITERLHPLHQEHACSEILELQEILSFTNTEVPQLCDVNKTLERMAGFRMEPVAGLVSARTFLYYLGRRVFLSTQYIRHHSRPFYTPEPDIVHELIGHAATLTHPGIAEVNRLLGRAVSIASDEEVEKIARVYWYTLEFGLVEEKGKIKALGAGLLSSIGEIQSCMNKPLRDWDLNAMMLEEFDPTRPQTCYYVAPSFTRLLTDMSCWLRLGGWRAKNETAYSIST